MGLIYIVVGIVIIIGTGLALTGKGRYFIKGLSNLFFTDLAKTPKGAEAIYTQAIEEAQNAYNKASNNLQRIAGMLDTAKRNFEDSQNRIKITQSKCEELAKRQMFDKVELFAQELQGLEEDLTLYKNEVAKYTPMFNEAKMLCSNYEQKLVKLRKDKKTVVRQLELNMQTKEMYDDLDELKNVKSSDKLLESVKEGVVETNEMAIGAKTVHQNKLSTRLLEAEQSVKSVQSNDYIEQLRKKYQK